MKSFILACAAAIIIAVIGYAALEAYQQPSSKAFSSTNSVRLDATDA